MAEFVGRAAGKYEPSGQTRLPPGIGDDIRAFQCRNTPETDNDEIIVINTKASPCGCPLRPRPHSAHKRYNRYGLCGSFAKMLPQDIHAMPRMLDHAQR